MFENHPITVPAGSITGWKTLYRETYHGDLSETEYIATQAASWGADQELEACCEWLDQNTGRWDLLAELRAARRPKPLSLKKQALFAIDTAVADGRLSSDVSNVVRRALEALPND